ncbi:uncharacterized protein PV07_07175 [Cladophialophora immunda]|uniref:Uncharacterized protein n=1 Tax=Cladophialophora immunda TaxID=569365 RepID=A0A0D2CUW2_9EURO|nr:uncharacterized protein PV07_07175 [Cladophialophora immunda]KIW27439.1 hypothetical protein PV07_07175 [Cladophialophora immunda]
MGGTRSKADGLSLHTLKLSSLARTATWRLKHGKLGNLLSLDVHLILRFFICPTGTMAIIQSFLSADCDYFIDTHDAVAYPESSTKRSSIRLRLLGGRPSVFKAIDGKMHRKLVSFCKCIT